MKSYLITLFLALSAHLLIAQSLELNELKTPSTPAFTILGLSPTDISRPTMTESFFLSIANGLEDNGIASDVAIETTPFWWTPRRGLTYREYYGIAEDSDKEVQQDLLKNIGRTFALSIATSDASPDIDTIDSRNLSGGIRFQILNGSTSNEFIKDYETIKALMISRYAVSQARSDVNSYPQNDVPKVEILKYFEKHIVSFINNDDAYSSFNGEAKDKIYENIIQILEMRLKDILD